MNAIRNYLLPILLCVVLCHNVFVDVTSSKAQAMIGYKVTPKVTYGQGKIITDGHKLSRDLWMDVYEPADDVQHARPAVIMTFGGSFHRGGPRVTFEVDGVQDTSMGDYCQKFAQRGYVCFAIDYRLAPENPVLSMSEYSKENLDMESFNFVIPQINSIRKNQGSEALDVRNPADITFVRDIVMSAAEDLNKAVKFIRESSIQYNIYPDRIVLGGFSAGAVTTWNVGHGMHAPVAGVFTLSGGNIGFDITKNLTAKNPPSLMFLGQHDLEQAHEAMALMLQTYEKVGAEYTFSWVPGFGHFYPAGATSLSGDGSKMSVEARILEFLDQTVGQK